MDRERGLARCPHCDTVVELDFSRPKPQRREWWERDPVPMPSGFEVVHDAGKMQISWSWFRLQTLVWFAFLVGWFVIGFGAWVVPRAGQAPGIDPSELPFAAIAGIIGVVMAYITLAGFLNTTVILATHAGLEIQHGPLPWPGNGHVDCIHQLFTKERVRRSRRGGTRYSYELHALTSNGDQRRVVGRLTEAAQALWLEQQLEERLGIRDRPIEGEVPRH